MTIDKVRKIIREAGYGDLATCVDGQPRVRPMAFVVMDDLRLWSSTYRRSGKIKELMENNRVEVCFVGRKKVQVRIEGMADISGGPEKKKLLLDLNPKVGRHFSDEYDPNFVHIEIVPTLVRWTEPGFGEYHRV
ncbi:MAG: pyridoxamine 5'-phosphate oxidase family protein [Candidatus Euphemobacter frigidus]|nr:pyridoxamine 5'-phosphate oxidase family protein [Candidatus Euphemobacter frigidus]MDP8276315.1 pyridoxamine 5'-phosphate oxidase family protein [Candidatus Euphemobacter frigidus]